MILSRAYYRSRSRANMAAARRSVDARYTPRHRARVASVIGNGLIVVGGMEYAATDISGDRGTVIAVANANRPASAKYTPAYGQTVAGSVGVSAKTTTTTTRDASASADSTYLRADGTTGGASAQDQTFVNGVIGNFLQESGIAQISDDYTITDADAWIIVTGGSYTQTLPDATASAGRQYTITNGHENTGETVTVDCTGGQTINGSSSATLAEGETLRVRSDGSNWREV